MQAGRCLCSVCSVTLSSYVISTELGYFLCEVSVQEAHSRTLVLWVTLPSPLLGELWGKKGIPFQPRQG